MGWKELSSWIKGSIIGGSLFAIICLVIIILGMIIGGFAGMAILFMGSPWIFIEGFANQFVPQGINSGASGLTFFFVSILINFILSIIVGGLIGYFLGRKTELK